MTTQGSTVGARIGTHRLVLSTHVLVCAVVAAACSLGSIVQPLHLLLLPLAYAATLLFLWGLFSWIAVTGSVFNLYGIFWAAACCFNVGQLFVVAFEKSKGPLLNGFLSQNSVVIAGYMGLLGLAFTHLGALIQAPRVSHVAPVFDVSTKSLRVIGWLLLVVGSVTAIPVYLRFFTLIREGGYLALYSAQSGDDANSRLFGAASVVLPGILFLCAGARDNRKLRALAIVLALAFAGLNFAVGMRAMAMFIVVGLPLVWHYGIKRIPVAFLVGAAVVVGGFILPLIGAARQAADPGAFDASQLTPVDPATTTLNEAGFSMVTNGFTYELVPSVRDYDYGRSYGYALTSILPDSISKPMLDTISAEDKQYRSDWLIHTVDPEWAETGGGFGFSYLAEAYLNFGWVGLVLVTPLLGFLIAWVSRLGTLRAFPGLVAMVGSMVGAVAAFPRSESIALVRLVSWYAVAPLLMAIVVERLVAARQRDIHGREVACESA